MSQLKYYSIEEIKENKGENGKPVWIIINNSIYNVTQFLDEHPGGRELIEEYSGKDATRAFNQAGHSRDAEVMLKKYKIGEILKKDDGAKEERVKRRFKLFFCI